MPTFFRKCPGCGKRFGVRVTEKKLLDEQLVTSPVTETTQTGMARMPNTFQQEIPVTIEKRKFQYTYKCGHCKHEWVEVVHSERKVGG